MANSKFFSIASVAALICLTAAGSVQAQAFTKADSGWVRLFNGVDFTGFYSRLYAAPVVHPVDTTAFNIIYPGTDTACIRVKTTTKRGEVGTDRTNFSHYRTRMEYRFDTAVASYNGGLLYGVDESVIRMQNNWPRGVEFQTQQSQPGAAYSIQQVTFNTRVTGSSYNATGTLVNVCEISHTNPTISCNARSYLGNPNIPSAANNRPKWMRIELIQRGSDTAWHIVNDTLVMKIWNIRIFNDSTKKTGGTTTSGGATLSNFTPDGPYPSGGLAVEGEGALVNHRRWEVMEFPSNTPMSENYLHRMVLDNPKQGIKPVGGSAVSIQWRSIGPNAKVKLEYKVGIAGAWQTITDSTANTGTYSWNAPTSVPDSLRVRISSYAYVVSDSTGSVGFTTALRSSNEKIRSFSFNMDGNGLNLSGVASYKQVEVSDIFGKQVRVMAVTGENFRWNLTASNGARVSKGVYFVRLKGAGASQTFRIPIF